MTDKMNGQVSFRHFVILLALMIFVSPLLSQVVVERSKDKIMISGVTYYLHQVKKGETIYSISRAYGITTEQLLKENRSAAEGLKEGQTIRIPVSLVSSAPQPQTPVNTQVIHDDSRFIYHILQPGETVYYLSKTYNVEEGEIIKSNPGIDITKLSTGSEIAIPKKIQVPEEQKISDQDAGFYYHKVIQGETLSSIARMYGITLRSLRRGNRDVRFPQVGDYVKIPGKKPVQSGREAPVVKDTVPVITEENPVLRERPAELTPVSKLRGSLNVAVLLPFYLNENVKKEEIDSSQIFKGKKIYKVFKRPEDFIYPRSTGFIEMYEGILLAADTLRSLGLDIDIHTFDIVSDTIEVTRLIQSGKLDRMDLIIGPVHSKNLSIVAAYAGTLGIPVVSPVQLLNNSVLINNPSLFLANSSLEVAQSSIAGKLRDYYNDNVVVITDSTAYDRETGRLKSLIMNELASKMPAEEVKLKELIFYSRASFGADSVNRLTHSLSDKSENVVIIASENVPVMSESIADVHTFSRKYDMKVFGYPEMRYLDNLDPKLCFDLGLMIYSPYWIDYSKPDVKQFIREFRNKFYSQPSEVSYAWQGYDIAYYFMSGLAIHGREFIRHPEIHNPDLLQTEFDFRRKSNADGFENQKLFLVRYTNNYDLELVPETENIP
jgi:LysM repeat protein/ABC-type branched-subunit amino acid transport system substrate-binding protein